MTLVEMVKDEIEKAVKELPINVAPPIGIAFIVNYNKSVIGQCIFEGGFISHTEFTYYYSFATRTFYDVLEGIKSTKNRIRNIVHELILNIRIDNVSQFCKAF